MSNKYEDDTIEQFRKRNASFIREDYVLGMLLNDFLGKLDSYSIHSLTRKRTGWHFVTSGSRAIMLNLMVIEDQQVIWSAMITEWTVEKLVEHLNHD